MRPSRQQRLPSKKRRTLSIFSTVLPEARLLVSGPWRRFVRFVRRLRLRMRLVLGLETLGVRRGVGGFRLGDVF
jgi:hypothetical protein